MNEKEITSTSKFLSFVLRHEPQSIGIMLDPQGWTDIDTLIRKVNEANVPLTLEALKIIVETSPKKRFAFNEALNMIRANQGHSVEVELGYKATKPPSILYHGTGEKSIAQIRQEGLKKGQRHHVHLSADKDTALKVGRRHGKPFIFEVLADQMFADNFEFFVSENGVWLTDSVPSNYLK
jgi:putative RNA 2'-phosphotransferase